MGQLHLGAAYSNGDGVPKDSVQAVFWYNKSANQGNTDAQYLLAFMYVKGDGVPNNLVIAYMWRNLAAAKGDEDAKNLIALLEVSMTPAQIAEGQRLSREWRPKNP